MVEKKQKLILLWAYRETKTSNLRSVFVSFTAEQFRDKCIYKSSSIIVNNKEAIA